MVQHICAWFYVNVYVCQWKSEPAIFFTVVGRELSLVIWGLEGGYGWCEDRQTGIESIKDPIVFEFPQRDGRVVGVGWRRYYVSSDGPFSVRNTRGGSKHKSGRKINRLREGG